MLGNRLHTFPEGKKKTDQCKILFLQQAVVFFYVAIQKTELARNSILVEDNKVTDIEKIPVPMQTCYARRDFHEKKEFAVYAAVGFQ